MSSDNLYDLLMRLERRLIAIEMAMQISPDSVDLLHPKAVKQAEAKKAIAAALQNLAGKEKK